MSVPTLSSSFVAATSSSMGTATAKPVVTGRGPVDLTSSTDESGEAGSSAPAVSGIQFSIGGSSATQRKSRWSSKDPASALFKQDTAESKLASQTAAPPAPAHNAYAAAQSPYGYAAATPAASTAWAQWQQQQQATASAAAFNAYNPQQSAAAAAPAATPAAAPASASANYWADKPGLLEYVDRSLAQCPAHLKPQTETYLRDLMTRVMKEGHGNVIWATEPLAHLQVLGNVAQAKAKAAAVAAALAPAASGGGKYVNFLAQQQQQHQHHQKGFKGTSSNTQPLGPRRSVPTGESKEEGEDSDDEQYIPLGKGKKRAWGATDDKNGHVGKKSKKNKGAGGKGQPAYDAVDLAKQSDRASRFRDYNESVARSSNDGFKNPIQRHTFTAERGSGGFGDEDVELDWSSLHIQGTCQRLEKRYLRLTQAPDPADVRPEPVLQRSLQMVLDKWRQAAPAASAPNPDHLHDYKYTCEQLKSIRQDLTVQHCIHSPLTISVYEHHARIALEVGDFSEYNITQTQLKNLYFDNPDQRHNQVEFVSYRILYNLITNNQSALNAMLREIQTARIDQAKERGDAVASVEPLLSPTSRSAPTDPLSLAFAVSMAALQKDYYNFFRLYRSLPFQGPQILRPFVVSLRFSALTTLMRAFKPGKVTLDFMHRSEQTRTRAHVPARVCQWCA